MLVVIIQAGLLNYHSEVRQSILMADVLLLARFSHYLYHLWPSTLSLLFFFLFQDGAVIGRL